jgi:hypothetical protein
MPLLHDEGLPAKVQKDPNRAIIRHERRVEPRQLSLLGGPPLRPRPFLISLQTLAVVVVVVVVAG